MPIAGVYLPTARQAYKPAIPVIGVSVGPTGPTGITGPFGGPTGPTGSVLTGTSGATVPLLNGNNVWSGTNYWDDVEINLSGQANSVHPVGTRGPLFIWNDPSSNLNGQNTCAQFWMGNNPVDIVGSGNYIPISIVAINGNGRSNIWGATIIAGQSNNGTGWVQGPLIGLEIDTFSDPSWTVGQTPFQENPVTNLELYADSVAPVTNAMTIWSNDATGNFWMYEGISISRCINYGIHFYNLAGDPTAFSGGAIRDDSISPVTLTVTGEHNSIIDISGVTGPTGTNLVNAGNNSIIFRAGNTTIFNAAPTGQIVLSQGFTVSTLPSGLTGGRAYITDATGATGFGVTPTGGGHTVLPVFSNGAGWVLG